MNNNNIESMITKQVVGSTGYFIVLLVGEKHFRDGCLVRQACDKFLRYLAFRDYNVTWAFEHGSMKALPGVHPNIHIHILAFPKNDEVRQLSYGAVKRYWHRYLKDGIICRAPTKPVYIQPIQFLEKSKKYVIKDRTPENLAFFQKLWDKPIDDDYSLIGGTLYADDYSYLSDNPADNESDIT